MKKYGYSSKIEYRGKSLTVKQVALQHRMVPETLLYRMNVKEWTVAKALAVPVQNWRAQNRLPNDHMTRERTVALRKLEKESRK
jgi:hypothetical protein